MAKYLMRKILLQFHGRFLEHFYRRACKTVELLRIAPYQMREDGSGNHGILSLQPLYRPGHVLRSKPQAVHTGIQLMWMGKFVIPSFSASLIKASSSCLLYTSHVLERERTKRRIIFLKNIMKLLLIQLNAYNRVGFIPVSYTHLRPIRVKNIRRLLSVVLLRWTPGRDRVLS